MGSGARSRATHLRDSEPERNADNEDNDDKTADAEHATKALPTNSEIKKYDDKENNAVELKSIKKAQLRVVCTNVRVEGRWSQVFQTKYEKTAEQRAWTQTAYFEELMATEQVRIGDKPKIAELKARAPSIEQGALKVQNRFTIDSEHDSTTIRKPLKIESDTILTRSKKTWYFSSAPQERSWYIGAKRARRV